MTKKLHELIEMAERGEKFEAFIYGRTTLNQNHFCGDNWSREAIKAEWTVRMKREPRVMYSVEVEDGILEGNFFTREIAEKYGKTIKFIEVIE